MGGKQLSVLFWLEDFLVAGLGQGKEWVGDDKGMRSSPAPRGPRVLGPRARSSSTAPEEGCAASGPVLAGPGSLEPGDEGTGLPQRWSRSSPLLFILPQPLMSLVAV